MGVNISELLGDCKEYVEIEELTGRKMAIDALNVLFQFISIIRQPEGTPLKDSKGRITSHLSGLFYRTAKFLEAGIKPCYVFDGKPPKFKSSVNLERKIRRKEAQEKYQEALEKGDIEEAKKKIKKEVKESKETMSLKKSEDEEKKEE